MMFKLAIFASGTGSNAINICNYFTNHPQISVAAICTNNPEAPVIDSSKALGIDTYLFDRQSFYHTSEVTNYLESLEVNCIILAGFLWLVPEKLLQTYPGRIINIHPSLLPKHGGKGMFGNRVHQAVLEAKEAESGITIHLVDEAYDQGEILFQATCPINDGESIEQLKQNIHALEHQYFPKVIEAYVSNHLITI